MAPKNEDSKTNIREISLGIPIRIRNYFDDLVTEFQEIREIWLLGSRANNCAREVSDWDFLVFANLQFLEVLSRNQHLRNQAHLHNIDLLILYDKDNFKAPWISDKDEREGKGVKEGTLTQWKFEIDREDPNTGYYEGYDKHAPPVKDHPNLVWAPPIRFVMHRVWIRDKGWLVLNNEDDK